MSNTYQPGERVYINTIQGPFIAETCCTVVEQIGSTLIARDVEGFKHAVNVTAASREPKGSMRPRVNLEGYTKA